MRDLAKLYLLVGAGVVFGIQNRLKGRFGVSDLESFTLFLIKSVKPSKYEPVISNKRNSCFSNYGSFTCEIIYFLSSCIPVFCPSAGFDHGLNPGAPGCPPAQGSTLPLILGEFPSSPYTRFGFNLHVLFGSVCHLAHNLSTLE